MGSILERLLRQAKDYQKKEKPLLVVFDVDSTLFHIHTRNQAIIKAFFSKPEVNQSFSREAAIASKVEFLPKDWGFKASFQRSGLENLDGELSTRLHSFWEKKFFSNEFLKNDIPVEGAREYLKALLDSHGHIKYLTGRDQPRMLQGTIDSFRRWQFPLSENSSGNCELVLKADHRTPDEDFKKDVLKKWAQDFDFIYFIDNEPINLNMAEQSFPEMELIFMDTTHQGQQKPPDRAHHISDFKLKSPPGEHKPAPRRA